MNEEWRSIDGSNNYEVSSLGNVRKLSRISLSGRSLSAGDVSTRHDKDGYMLVDIDYLSYRKTEKVHRLVLKAFIGEPLDSQQCNHRDGVRDNNCISNLEWCNASENLFHKTRVNKRGCGVDHYKSNLSNAEIRNAREKFNNREWSLTDVSNNLRIQIENARKVVTGKTYIHSGGPVSTGKEFHRTRPGRRHDLRLSDDDVRVIRGMLSRGAGVTEIARVMKTSTRTVINIRKGVCYKCVA